MSRVLCAWCRRFKGRGGWPIGPVRSLETASSHGICRDCATRFIAQVSDRGDLPGLPGSSPELVSGTGSPEFPSRAVSAQPASSPARVRAEIRSGAIRENIGAESNATRPRPRADAMVRKTAVQADRRQAAAISTSAVPVSLAWIVVGPGLIELQTAGRTIRSLIFQRSSPLSKEKARVILASEARALGYTLVEDPSETAAHNVA